MKKLICAVIVLAVSTAGADTIFVDDDAPLGGDGLSWNTAYQFLQDALAVADDADEIRVAGGVYKPDRDEANPAGTGDQDASFLIGSDSDCCYEHGLPPCDDTACSDAVCVVDPSCCDCCLNEWDEECVMLAVALCEPLCTVPEGLTIRGGYAGFGAKDPDARDIDVNESILTGDLLDNDVPTDDFFDPSLADNSRHVLIGDGADALIDGVTIRGGVAPGNHGGGMRATTGSTSFQSCTFEANFASNGGAVALFDGAVIALNDCLLTNNRAGEGGAINAQTGSVVELTGCEISANSSRDCGGGVLVNGVPGSLTATDCVFDSNIGETQRGGAIFGRLVPVHLDGCTFTGNGDNNGSAVYVTGGAAHVIATDCVFEDNGGSSAVFLEGFENSEFTGCTFTGNTANGNGGAICHDSGGATVTDCEFIGNTATIGGAAVYCTVTSTYINCLFQGNSAEVGGAVRETGTASDFINCVFLENEADWGGAAECRGEPTFTNSIFIDNVAINDGGAVRVRINAEVNLVGCLFEGNAAGANGGAVVSVSGEAFVTNCTIVANTAGGVGGGINSRGDEFPTVTSTILWANVSSAVTTEDDQISYVAAFPPVVNYSCVEGLSGALGGTGNGMGSLSCHRTMHR